MLFVHVGFCPADLPSVMDLVGMPSNAPGAPVIVIAIAIVIVMLMLMVIVIVMVMMMDYLNCCLSSSTYAYIYM